MSINDRIEQAEKELEELIRLRDIGFTITEDYGSCYSFDEFHQIIRDTDGNNAGIVVDREIMKKYFSSLEE